MVVVVIEVAPEPAAEVAQAAVDGCNGALGAGSCELVSPARASAGEFHALVHADPQRSEAFVVELRRARSGRVLETRELRFSEQDTSLQRSSSLGVVIAALVVAQGRREQTAPPPRPPPPPPPPPKPEASPPGRAEPPPPAPSRALRIDAGVSLARALEEHPTALGGLGRLSLVFEPSPLFAMIGGGYESALSAEPHLAWYSGTLGLGVRAARGAALSLELRGELLVQHTSIEAQDPLGTETATAGRWRAGGRLGLDGIWAWSDRLALVAGGQVSVLRPSVVIVVRDEVVERAPGVSGGVFLGVRFSP